MVPIEMRFQTHPCHADTCQCVDVLWKVPAVRALASLWGSLGDWLKPRCTWGLTWDDAKIYTSGKLPSKNPTDWLRYAKKSKKSWWFKWFTSQKFISNRRGVPLDPLALKPVTAPTAALGRYHRYRQGTSCLVYPVVGITPSLYRDLMGHYGDIMGYLTNINSLSYLYYGKWWNGDLIWLNGKIMRISYPLVI